MKKILALGMITFLLVACTAQTPPQQAGDQETIKALETTIEDLRERISDLEETLVTSEEALKALTLERDELTENLENTEAELNKIIGEVGSDNAILTTKGAKSIIEDRAVNVLYALRDANFERLSKYVHPTKGVRFTAITHVDMENDLVFSRDEVKDFLTDYTLYTWGAHDGSGDPIVGTPFTYYETYMYKVDYLSAPNVSYNEQIGYGNAIDNSAEVYPGAIRVEYHYPGFDDQYEGMDWTSLRLVFEKHTDGKWYLVGLIHNMWTI